MARLYVIGNGFDCHAHSNVDGKMKTSYQDFRDYLIRQYPNCLSNKSVPEEKMVNDHREYDYDKNDMVGYIVSILDDCENNYWSSIEESLGGDVFDALSYEFDTDYDDMNDAEESRARNNNDELAERIKLAFGILKELFYDWVSNSLSAIQYSTYKPVPAISNVINDVKSNNGFYLTFNYTKTLEQIYGINEDNVCHIHGIVGDSFENIYFGHGSDKWDTDLDFYLYESTLNDLHEELRKDTSIPIDKLKDWLKGIDDITEIYSYGFSFSKVDMDYINEIKKCVDLNRTVWYLNSYDYANNGDYSQKLKDLGFKVQPDKRW